MGRETQMLRFECGQCDMVATVVESGAARRAWWDHMQTHYPELDYRLWTWQIVELPFE